MLYLHQSNKLTHLAGELARELEKKMPDDPFEAQLVVVPNHETSRWLKLILAEMDGITANIEFILPSEWQFRQIRSLYPNLPDLLPADPGPLSWLLFDMLTDSEKRKQFSRPDQYISGQAEETLEQAAMQLSKKIASVFDQYLVYRPELILKWQNGELSGDEDEQWQAALWSSLETERKKREGGTGYPNKAELIAETKEAARKGELPQSSPIFLFNPGLIPQPIARLVKELSVTTDIYLYRHTVTELTDTEDKNPLVRIFGDEARGARTCLMDQMWKSEKLITQKSRRRVAHCLERFSGQSLKTEDLMISKQTKIPIPDLRYTPVTPDSGRLKFSTTFFCDALRMIRS